MSIKLDNFLKTRVKILSLDSKDKYEVIENGEIGTVLFENPNFSKELWVDGERILGFNEAYGSVELNYMNCKNTNEFLEALNDTLIYVYGMANTPIGRVANIYIEGENCEGI